MSSSALFANLVNSDSLTTRFNPKEILTDEDRNTNSGNLYYNRNMRACMLCKTVALVQYYERCRIIALPRSVKQKSHLVSYNA
jgi:hypothetical protein